MEIFPDEEKEALDMISLFFLKRRFIIGSTIGLAILALIASFILPNKYGSEAIVFPTSSNSREAILENPSFGYEGHSNQLLQILQSSTLKDSLIKRFDLVSHFEIDTTKADWYSKLNKEIDKSISYERTPYGSIRIRATTSSPELSADMVNYSVKALNHLLQNIFEHNIKSTFTNYESEYLAKKLQVEVLQDSLASIKNYNTETLLGRIDGQMKQTYDDIVSTRTDIEQLEKDNSIYFFDEQITLLSNQAASSSARYNHLKAQFDELKNVLDPKDTTLLKIKGEMTGAQKNADTAQAQLENLNKVRKHYEELNLNLNNNLSSYTDLKNQKRNLENAFEPTVQSAQLTELESRLKFERELLEQLKAKYENAKSKSESELPSIYVISKGRPIYKRVSPSRLKSILLGGALGFLFSTGWVLARRRLLKLKEVLRQG